MLIRYVGPHRPGVDVESMAHGAVIGLVEHSHQVDLPDEVANGLLEQGPDHWQPVKSKKKES